MQEYSKISPRYAWSIFVFGNDTNKLGYSGWESSDKYFWKFKYGKYNLTYLGYADVTCYNPGTNAGTAEFGQDITDLNKQKIKDLVSNSVIYRGDDIQGAAEYLRNQLQQNIKGSWAAVVTSPNTSYGYYACRYKENWANLRGYEQLKWSYILLKNYL